MFCLLVSPMRATRLQRLVTSKTAIIFLMVFRKPRTGVLKKLFETEMMSRWSRSGLSASGYIDASIDRKTGECNELLISPHLRHLVCRGYLTRNLLLANVTFPPSHPPSFPFLSSLPLSFPPILSPCPLRITLYTQ